MKKITLLLFAIVALSFQSYAQDTCAAAVAVIPGTTTGTTITIGTGSAEMAPTGADSAWFVYSATADGTIDVSACGGGSDTDLSIGTGLCGSLTILAQNDDSCDLGNGNNYASELTGVVVAAGTDYYIEWSNEWDEGPFDWTLTYTPPPACGDATNVAATAFDTNADFSWDAPIAGTPVGYNWEIQPNGVAQGTAGALASGTVAGTTVNSGAVLTAATAYEFYVQTDCNPDGTANYATVGFLTTAGPAPANDNFVDAIAISAGTTVAGTTLGATIEEDDAPDGTAADLDTANVWYSFTGSGVAEDVTLSTCGVVNTDYDTEALIYTGTSGNLIYVAEGYDECGGSAEGYHFETTFTSDGTSTYWISMSGFNGAEGNFEIVVSAATLSTDTFENENAFTYFPNPVKNELTLNAQKDIQNVAVYNMLGQEVIRTAPNTVNSTVNMNELSQGAYFVKVTIGNVTETIRVIKQ
jgi:hypothetical protein